MAFDLILMVSDWGNGLPVGAVRYYLGVPLIVVGALFVLWGIVVLGIHRTSGMADALVVTGPYKFTRNPQYVGDMLLFLGMIVVSNSFAAGVGWALLILSFALMPLSEEIWLDEVYGTAYREYKTATPRFL